MPLHEKSQRAARSRRRPLHRLLGAGSVLAGVMMLGGCIFTKPTKPQVSSYGPAMPYSLSSVGNVEQTIRPASVPREVPAWRSQCAATSRSVQGAAPYCDD